MLHLRLFVVLLVSAFVITSCGTDGTDIVTDEQPSQSGAAVTATSADKSNTSTPLAGEQSTSTNQPSDASPTTDTVAPQAPTTPATATAAPEEEQKALIIVSSGLGQPEGERGVGWAFVVENPNTGLAIERTEYQLAAYDEAGTVLETSSGYISLLLPNERTAVGGSMYLADGLKAHRIEVMLNDGDAEPLEPASMFTSDHATYYPDEYSPKVSGIINNPYNRDLESVHISAVAFDENDVIIGGGFTYANFIPASSSTGAMLSVATSGEPVRVELYAALSSLTLMAADTAATGTYEPLVLTSFGFGQEEGESTVGWGFIVQNPNADQGFELSMYNVAAYDETGSVIGIDTGYVYHLLGGETLGLGGSIYLPDNTVAARIDVKLLAGDPADDALEPMLRSDNATYMGDGYWPKATGSITNLTDQTLEDIQVAALAYNDAGEIIGGGFTYVEFVPAGGQAAVEVTLTTSGVPARVELYPTVTSLTFLSN